MIFINKYKHLDVYIKFNDLKKKMKKNLVFWSFLYYLYEVNYIYIRIMKHSKNISYQNNPQRWYNLSICVALFGVGGLIM